jgi:hypothetical protein
VFFIPVSSVGDLKSSLRLGNVIALEDGPAGDRLSLRTPEKTIPVKLAHGFAFLTEDAALIEQPLPDPAASLGAALESYDAAVIVRRDGIPDSLMNFGVTALEALSTQGIPREARETDADYQLKKDLAALGFDMARTLISDVERLTIGWKLAPEAESLTFEADLVCRPDGQALATLNSLAASPARFASVIAEPSPMAVVYHLTLPDRIRPLAEGVLERIRTQAGTDMSGDAAALKPHVLSTIDTLRQTVAAGQIDGFLQVVGGPPEHFFAIGGIALVNEAPVAAALRAVLPFAGDASKGRTIEMDAAKIHGADFHRIRNIEARPQDRLVYGDDMSLLLGVGQAAAWFGLGGDATSRYLGEVVQPASAVRSPADNSLLLIQFQLTDWLGLIGEDADQNARNFRAIAQRAFPEPEEDRIEFSIAPTSTGVRARLSFEQGYLRLIGHAIAAAEGRQ